MNVMVTKKKPNEMHDEYNVIKSMLTMQTRTRHPSGKCQSDLCKTKTFEDGRITIARREREKSFSFLISRALPFRCPEIDDDDDDGNGGDGDADEREEGGGILRNRRNRRIIRRKQIDCLLC